MKDVFIYDAIRSARTRAKANGGLHPLTPPELLKPLYQTLAQRNQLDPALVSEVILGCVTQHGEQAGNIAKTSALFAGWPESVSGLTVHRFCSSSIDAIALAGLKVATGQTQAIVAGGVEMEIRQREPATSSPSELADQRILALKSSVDALQDWHVLQLRQRNRVQAAEP